MPYVQGFRENIRTNLTYIRIPGLLFTADSMSFFKFCVELKNE